MWKIKNVTDLWEPNGWNEPLVKSHMPGGKIYGEIVQFQGWYSKKPCCVFDKDWLTLSNYFCSTWWFFGDWID